MEIRELRAFLTVVDEGGVSAAARVLHVSQSALSQTVRSLERQAGGRLLVRDHTGARPTELGTAVLRETRALVDSHDRLVASIAALTAPTADAGAPLRLGVPLELPSDLLPAIVAEMSVAHPDTAVLPRHLRSTAQLVALRAGELDVALVRDRPGDPLFDSVLAVEEAMGVVLPSSVAERLAEPEGVRLHRLSGMSWVGFSRADTPAWHDQVVATLRGHGVTGIGTAGDDNRPVPREVKLAAVAGPSRAFALASPRSVHPLPAGLAWHPLVGNPVVRRTWAVWRADARRRELSTLIAALDVT
jgi:DNA-binding transcriptional LysR family regulator